MARDLESTLQSAADAVRRASELRLAHLLAELDRLDTFASLPLEGSAREEIDARVAAIDRELHDLLVRWRRIGGQVRFEMPRTPEVAAGSTAPAATVPEPRPVELTRETSGGPAADVLASTETAAEAVAQPAALEPTAHSVPAAPTEAVASGYDEAESGGTIDAPTPSDAPPPRQTDADDAPARKPASIQALLALRDHVASGRNVALGGTADEPWMGALTELLSALGPPRDDDHELGRVTRAVQACGTWSVFPRDVQRMLVGLLAARMRHLQDEVHVDSAMLNETFSALTAYSGRERPGFVFGLSRGHSPVGESWIDDAEAYWEQLTDLVPAERVDVPNRERMLARIEELVGEIDRAPAVARSAVRSQAVREVRAALKAGVSGKDPGLVRVAAPLSDALTGSEFRALRRALRDAATEPEDDEGPSDPLPPDWAWWERTRGRRAIMVGGSPRELNRQRLQEAFQFESLDWQPAEHRRNSLTVVRDRVLAGSVDVVIILNRFVGHDADQIILPACRTQGVERIHVDHGYGIGSIRRAIERFTEPVTDAGTLVVTSLDAEREGQVAK